MADHLRTQIRDAVLTRVTGLTTTSTRAYAGRAETRPLQPTELPGLLIYTNETESEEASGTRVSRRFIHLCDIVIDGFAKGTGDMDKTLDTIEKEVRVALEAAPTLGGLSKDLVCTNVSKEDDPESEQPCWRVRMTWRCEYHTREGAPDAALA
jgi:hypothetical protein